MIAGKGVQERNGRGWRLVQRAIILDNPMMLFVTAKTAMQSSTAELD